MKKTDFVNYATIGGLGSGVGAMIGSTGGAAIGGLLGLLTAQPVKKVMSENYFLMTVDVNVFEKMPKNSTSKIKNVFKSSNNVITESYQEIESEYVKHFIKINIATTGSENKFLIKQEIQKRLENILQEMID